MAGSRNTRYAVVAFLFHTRAAYRLSGRAGLCSYGIFLFPNKGIAAAWRPRECWVIAHTFSALVSVASHLLHAGFLLGWYSTLKMLLYSSVSWSWIRIFVLVFLSFFRAPHTLFLFSYRQHGFNYSGISCCSLGYSREFLLLFLHWFRLVKQKKVKLSP
jgi:hypothetical protein